MKTLTIGSTSFEIVSCTRMRDIKRGFYLDIKIPKTSISMDELSALLDGNEQTITITDGENVSAYNGFKQLSSLSLENGVYTACQVCTSEIEAQLSIAQNKIAEQAKELEVTKQVVDRQTDIIAAQGEVINNQGVVIEGQVTALAEQAKTITELETANTELKTIQETNDAELLYQVCLLQLGLTEEL